MDLQLDPDDWDLVIEGADLQILDKSDAIAQHVQQRLWLFQGEYFLDETVGVPYFQSILKKRPDLYVVDAVLKDTILNTPGILELISFDLDYNASTRSLRVVNFKARALDGVVDFGSLELNQAAISGG
jgi:hypothetical protein